LGPARVRRERIDRRRQHDDTVAEQRLVLVAEFRQLGGAAARSVERIEGEHDDFAAKRAEGDGHRLSGGVGGLRREIWSRFTGCGNGRRGLSGRSLRRHRCGQRKRREKSETSRRDHWILWSRVVSSGATNRGSRYYESYWRSRRSRDPWNPLDPFRSA